MDKKPKKVKNGIFSKFLPTFRYFFGTLPKIHHVFATTIATTYLKVIHINIFMKKLFSDGI